MASDKQLKANRENALKGGVKTVEKPCPSIFTRHGVSVIVHGVPVTARENVNNKFCGTNPISNFYGSKSPP